MKSFEKIEFSQKHIAFWENYGVTIGLLQLANVFAIKSNYDLSFVYGIAEGVYKIYNPNAPKNNKFIWDIKEGFIKPSEVIYYLDSLPEFCDCILIVEGMKDCLSANSNLNQFGIYAIGLDSAQSLISDDTLKFLQSKSSNVLLCLDNDSTGKTQNKAKSKKTGLNYLPYISDFENSKDISDIFANEFKLSILKNWIFDNSNYKTEFEPPKLNETDRLLKYIENSEYEICQREIISACIMDGADFFYSYCSDLKLSYFQSDYAVIWQIIIDLAEDFEPNINILYVAKEVRKSTKLSKNADIIWLNRIFTNSCAYSLISKQYYIDRLIELNLRKNTFETCLKTLNDSLDETKGIIKTISETQSKLDCENLNLEDITLDFLPEFTDAILNKNEVLYKSYITCIDKILNGGFAKQDLTLIAARPGMGKTEVGLHIAYENAKNGVPILYVSLEMSKQQLSKRIITKIINNEIGEHFDNKRLKDKNFTTKDIENIKHASKLFQTMPFYILDSADLKCENMLLKIASLKRKHKIELSILDHLHLIQHENQKLLGEEAVGRVGRECKKIAKHCDIPFIALAQLNRSVEIRSNKRPNNGDLRQSGQLEQDADNTIFLYRQDYYDMQENENYILTNEIEYIFGKNRSGSVQTGDGLIYLDTNTIKDLQ